LYAGSVAVTDGRCELPAGVSTSFWHDVIINASEIKIEQKRKALKVILPVMGTTVPCI
jgi:hypothetical protein